MRIAFDTVGRLVDADDEMIRELCGEMESRQADATAGVENQRRVACCFPMGDTLNKRGAVIVGNRLAVIVPGVPGDDCSKFFMDFGLRTGNR